MVTDQSADSDIHDNGNGLPFNFFTTAITEVEASVVISPIFTVIKDCL